MKLIVAVDKAWGIGRENKLLFSIPEDMAFFRVTTQGKIVVMGHSTLKSLPRSAPLKNRTNIVLSKDATLKIDGATVCTSISQLGRVLAAYSTDDIYVIGGHSVYSQLLPYCDEAFVTKVHQTAQADTFFPNIDENTDWVLAEKSEEKTHEDFSFCFCTYTNQNVKPMPLD